MKQIILASTSPRRHDILARSGLAFVIEEPDYEEDMTLDLTPPELAQYLSRGKAASVAAKHKGEDVIIISGDSFAAFGGHVIGKPHTPEKSAQVLRMLSGQFHTFITGYTIIDCATGRSVSKAVETKVKFRNLTDDEINTYVATGEPLDRSGAYAIKGQGAALVDHIEGDFDNVVGLPLAALLSDLKQFGIDARKVA